MTTIPEHDMDTVSVDVSIASNALAAHQAESGALSPRTPANAGQISSALYARTRRRDPSAVARMLSARDWDVLRSVDSHRYLTTRHIQAFHVWNHASAATAAALTRRLTLRLKDLRLITHLDRRVGGVRAGSASYVWRIGPIGDRLLHGGRGTRRWQYEPGIRFLDHCLAVADAHLALLQGHRAGQIELLRIDLEPTCWRRFTAYGGAAVVLQPDLYVVTGAGKFEDHWFVEIDRGTESLRTLLSKCERYEDYHRTGIEQEDGGSFPLVVWVMPNRDRAKRLADAVGTSNKLDTTIFRFTCGDGFVDLVAGGAV